MLVTRDSRLPTPRLPTTRVYHGATSWTTSVGLRYLIVVGGNVDSGAFAWSNRTDVFDYDESFAWSQASDMKVPRQFPAIGVIGEVVYVVGGANDKGVLSSVEVFDTANYYPGSGTGWTLLQTSIPSPISDASIGVLPQPNRCNPADIGGCNVCEECPAGYFSEGAGKSVCRACRAGFWSSSSGSDVKGEHETCTPCIAGKHGEAAE